MALFERSIDSVFGKSRLKNVTVSDIRGVFLTSPEIELDWSPGAWLYNSLHIDRLTAAAIERSPSPQFSRRWQVTSTRGSALMPGMVDIHAHTPMLLLRGTGEGLPTDRWLVEANVAEQYRPPSLFELNLPSLTMPVQIYDGKPFL